MVVFFKNLEEANRLQREEQGTAQYGITQFSDLTDDEFWKCHLHYSSYISQLNLTHRSEEAPPKSCDWRKKGVISKVKSQGKCCSCWAFAAVGNIEAQWGIFGSPKNLSVQQLIDCSRNYGCKGGFPWNAFMTVIKLGGLAREDDYQYKAEKGKCLRNTKPVATIQDFVFLQRDEKDFYTLIDPHLYLQYYTKGIIKPSRKNCDASNVDHEVLIVGFSREEQYWILKNSWGENWGENGFFRLHLGSNACGVAEYPVSAIVNTEKYRNKICPP
ncbi:hypothetical protein GDO86_008550 [Hymenochirus boettgeri]|uniref:Peptidase C1A papain C-terminal domain-containing protein n=1 Tax=Hymenochirus boettgeri TaxID=247094 RepID=A0A8T2J0U8_9PIPI|nr:hypothetical protein GDO86_008550 [Hymenochirus boettgeri]